jgi:hypothetical protein
LALARAQSDADACDTSGTAASGKLQVKDWSAAASSWRYSDLAASSALRGLREKSGDAAAGGGASSSNEMESTRAEKGLRMESSRWCSLATVEKSWEPSGLTVAIWGAGEAGEAAGRV